MTDRDTTDSRLQRELDALGEDAAAPQERTSAEGLASRLQGGLHAVEGEAEAEELAALAELCRALRGGDAAERAGAAATARILDTLLGGPAGDAAGPQAGPGAGSTAGLVAMSGADPGAPAEDAPADDLEARRAARLAAAVDRLVAGVGPAPGTDPGAEADLLETAVVIRASSHAQALSPARLEGLVDEALGRPAQTRRYRGSQVLLAVGLVGTLAASLVGLVLFWGGGPSTAPRVPSHLSSRSTRDILPGAFPRSQSESERIDLIYYDRLRAYRDLELGALAPDPDAAPARTVTPTAAFASRLGRGGIP